MTISTKNEILDHLLSKKVEPDLRNIEEFSAHILSSELHISRSLASQYLNGFVKEGLLVKIATRPVYFLSRKNIEEQFQVQLKESMFYSVEDFLDTLSKKTCIKRNFMKMIGYDTSLHTVIDQLKSALKYPPNGLPVILYGEKGSGKSLMCQKMFEYGQDAGIIPEQALLQKYKVLEQDMQLAEQLLGTEGKKGLLEQCEGGILYLTQAQNLSKHDQQLLMRILEDGGFIRGGIRITLRTRIILSLDEDYQKYLDYDLIQCFPIICRMPNLDERYQDDKEELIIHFFKLQSWKLGRYLFVSKNLIHILLTRTYKRNIDELKRTVEDVCARANSEEETTEQLYIRMYQLPDSILMDLGEQDYMEEQVEYVDISSYKRNEESRKLLELFETILNRVPKDESTSMLSYVKELNGVLTQYCSAIAYNEKYTNQQILALEHTIRNILNRVLTTYNVSIPYHCSPLFAACIYGRQSHNRILEEWKQEHAYDISKCLSLLEKQYPQGYLISEKLSYALLANLELGFDDMEKVILMIHLGFYHEHAHQNKYLSIIIAHGYSTASSMAEAINSLLGSYLFEAFDMPLDTSMPDIADRLKRYIDRYTIKNDILLLVDMGSLEHIDEQLTMIDNKNIGIINNVSTRLALDIGESILQGADMESLLRKAAEHSTSTYTLVENKQKKDLIIFISDNGIKMANRMRELFADSLPKAIDIEMLSIDLLDFRNDHYMNEIAKEYNILFVSGICSSIDCPKQFISLEDLITSNQLDYLRTLLNKYLTIEDIDTFTRNLIHNFSLGNALDTLSILDAKKLLEFVEGAVNQMQLQLDRRFYGNTLAGLYIHLCCMIERLVTKEPITNHEGLQQFEKENRKFIEIVRRSFTKVCSHYGVELSMSEISYLYDYIKEDKLHGTQEGDF